MRKETWKPREEFVCKDCRAGLQHTLLTLHAGENTIIVCSGAWEGLPEWMRNGFTMLKEAGKKGLEKRREMVGDIREHLRTG